MPAEGADGTGDRVGDDGRRPRTTGSPAGPPGDGEGGAVGAAVQAVARMYDLARAA